MVKPIHKVKKPYRDKLPDLIAGMVGGVLAGAGVSILIASRQSRGMGPQKQDQGKIKIAEPTKLQRITTSSSRRASSTRQKSKAPGTKLAASKIHPEELQAKEEPGTNDSLGG